MLVRAVAPMIGAQATNPRGADMKRILVATDGSPAAAEAVAVGVELAAEHASELMFVHVVPVVDIVPATGLAPIGGAFLHEPSEHDRTLLVEAADAAAEHGIFATTVLLRGDTVDEIVAFADSHDADVIVVGSRGRGAIAGALLGSVSRGVLAESKRPVMIVRAAAVPVAA
jgi:nucleotide-binding universal stress UspA family protein